MARKLKIMENEKHPLDDMKNGEITKTVKNEKCTLKDLEYGGGREEEPFSRKVPPPFPHISHPPKKLVPSCKLS